MYKDKNNFFFERKLLISIVKKEIKINAEEYV
jgi:hypothetical protein